MMTIRLILVTIISSLLAANIYLNAYNKGFDDGYVTGLIAQGLGMDSFENYDMPFTDKDDNKGRK